MNCHLFLQYGPHDISVEILPFAFLWIHWLPVRRLWSNPRESTQGNEKRKGEGSSYPKSIEVLLRKQLKGSHPDPEEVDNPMITPQIYDVRQSGRVLELQKQIFGHNQQICPGIFLFLWPFVSCLSGITVGDHPRSGRPERTRSRKPRSRNPGVELW